MTNHLEMGVPAEMLALAEEEKANLARRLAPNDRFLYAVWGLAWTVGFFGLWLTSGTNPPIDARPAGFWVYGALMSFAGVVTAVHIAGRVTGLHGRSRTLGQRFGATWLVAFAAYGLILAGLGRAALSPDAIQLLAPVLACFIVGLIYMAGGAAWDDRHQFALGTWLTLVAGSAAVVGNPAHLLVLAIAGGGGFLCAALLRPARHPTAR